MGFGEYYEKVERIYKFIVKMLVILVITTVLLITFPAFTITLKSYFTLDEMHTDSWILSISLMSVADH